MNKDMWTYTKAVYHSSCEDQERRLSIPSHWGMYSYAGNRSIQSKAKNLVAKLEKIWEDKGLGWKKRRAKTDNAVYAFLRSFRRMYNSKNYGESGDTAVRESVAGWVDEISVALRLDFDYWEGNEGQERGWP